MNVENVYELFMHDKEEFVRNVYLSLLRREPDRSGLEYYQGRLSMKYGKNRVIYQLAHSKECRKHDEINGLIDFLTEEEKCNKWFWKALWLYRYRFEKKIQNNVNHIIKERLNSMLITESNNNKEFNHLESGEKITNINNNNSLYSYSTEEAKMHKSIEAFLTKESIFCIDEYDFMNLDVVFNDEIFLRFIYLWMLGRPIDPEAFNIYSKFLKDNDRLKFVEMIITSEEFARYKSSNQIAKYYQENYPFGSNVSSMVEELLKL